MITQHLLPCQISLPQAKDILFSLRWQTLQILTDYSVSSSRNLFCAPSVTSPVCQPAHAITSTLPLFTFRVTTTAVTLPLTQSPPQWGLNQHEIIMTASPSSSSSQVCKLWRIQAFFSQVSVLQHVTPFKLRSFQAGLDQTQLGRQKALRNSARAEGGWNTWVMWLLCSGGAAAAAQSWPCCGHITPSLQAGVAPWSHTGGEKATKHIWQSSLKASYLLIVQFVFGWRGFAEHGMHLCVFRGNGSLLWGEIWGKKHMKGCVFINYWD